MIFNNGTCNAGSNTVSETESRTNSVAINWDVGVTGSAEWAAGALFTSLKATVEIEIDRGQSWTVTETEQYYISSTMAIQPCESQHFVARVTKKVATGTVTSGDHVIVCQCTECGATATNYCNKVVLSGTADGYSMYEYDWVDNGTVDGCDCEVVE